ncbi:MAG: hypothetical protein K8T25_01175, partial [Planctomycetia bacterium]|nr:hypothetical protein [Planctomycetia bacterium]
IDPSAFGAALASLDLSNIFSIKLLFDAGLGQEFSLSGPITLLTPEPLALLGWSMVLMVGLVGCRYCAKGRAKTTV